MIVLPIKVTLWGFAASTADMLDTSMLKCRLNCGNGKRGTPNGRAKVATPQGTNSVLASLRHRGPQGGSGAKLGAASAAGLCERGVLSRHFPATPWNQGLTSVPLVALSGGPLWWPLNGPRWPSSGDGRGLPTRLPSAPSRRGLVALWWPSGGSGAKLCQGGSLCEGEWLIPKARVPTLASGAYKRPSGGPKVAPKVVPKVVPKVALWENP